MNDEDVESASFRSYVPSKAAHENTWLERKMSLIGLTENLGDDEEDAGSRRRGEWLDALCLVLLEMMMKRRKTSRQGTITECFHKLDVMCTRFTKVREK